MVPVGSSAGALIERVREFDRLATLLDLPMAERLGVLNVPEVLYLELRSGRWPTEGDVRPEFERRLSYALPLMRRLASRGPGRGGASRGPGVGMQAA